MSSASLALDEQARRILTPEYSFNLATNFRPQRDYEANLRAALQPCAVLAGTADELFFTDKLEPMFRSAGKNWPVQLLPGIGHIPLSLDPIATGTAAQMIETLQRKAG